MQGWIPITKRLQGPDQRWRIGTTLNMEEVYAIGFATVMWAYLEHGLLIRTATMAEAANIPLPKDAKSSSFTKRLRAWRLLIEESVNEDVEREHWLNLVSRIANAEQDRHKLAHGLWDFDPKNPAQARVSSFRPSFEYEETFDYNKMCKLCDQLARINFELTYPNDDPFALPEDADEEIPTSYVSRSFLQHLAGSDIEDQGLLPAILPEPRPQRSPSQR